MARMVKKIAGGSQGLRYELYQCDLYNMPIFYKSYPQCFREYMQMVSNK
jgi:hypothetical protein